MRGMHRAHVLFDPTAGSRREGTVHVRFRYGAQKPGVAIRRAHLCLSLIEKTRGQSDQLTVHRHIGVVQAHRHERIPMTLQSTGVDRCTVRSTRDPGAARLQERPVATDRSLTGLDQIRERRSVVRIGLADRELRPEFSAREAGKNLLGAPLAQRAIDFDAHIGFRHASLRQRYAKLCEREIRFGAEERGACLHAVMKRQMLKRVQGVVVDEHTDRALVGQDAVRGGERSCNRIGILTDGPVGGHASARRQPARARDRYREP